MGSLLFFGTDKGDIMKNAILFVLFSMVIFTAFAIVDAYLAYRKKIANSIYIGELTMVDEEGQVNAYVALEPVALDIPDGTIVAIKICRRKIGS